MLLTRKIKLSEMERALLFKDKQFQRVLTPGVYRIMNFGGKTELREFVLGYEFKLEQDAMILALLKRSPKEFAEHIEHIQTGAKEVALIYVDGALADMLPPANEGFYWKTTKSVTVSKVDIGAADEVDAELLAEIRKPSTTALKYAKTNLVTEAMIADNHLGFLMKNGKFVKLLAAGYHAFWASKADVVIRVVDTRLQNMEVSGQEILTKDRVSIRINLLANWMIADAERLVLNVADFQAFIYKEIQLALRAVVSTRTLDELLADKNALNKEVFALVEQTLADYGVKLQSIGVKDIILPGEMKDILTQVVEAEKMAEANLIRRREETQATRSLHNTAKVMENNPTLLRLKELETLEKITDKIGNLTVYGGLDAVMQNLVSLTDKPVK